jgi:hypothetical protein
MRTLAPLSKTARRSAGAAIVAAALAGALAPSALAAGPGSVTARDTAATSVAPTNLVFSATGGTLTIGYDDATAPGVVAKLKSRGLIGTVACTVRTDQGIGAAGASVRWLKNASSVTVDLGVADDASLISCRLSQLGDSADPIQVFLDADAAQREELRLETLRLADTAKRAGTVGVKMFKTGFTVGGRDERDVAKLLGKADPAHTYRVAHTLASAVRTDVVYVLARTNKSTLYLAQRRSDGRVLVTTVAKRRVSTRVVSTGKVN